jgi:hypothetical protein
MLPDLDEPARREHRTRADLVRNSLRRYLASGRVIPVDNAEPDEVVAIERGRADIGQGDSVRLEDLQRELGLPTR